MDTGPGTPRQIYHMRGNAPDPMRKGRRGGYESTIDLAKSAIGHPRILAYAGHEPRIITGDVYLDPETGKLSVLIYCPVCGPQAKDEQALRIHEDNKRLEYNPHVMSPLAKYLREGGDPGEECPCGCGRNFFGGRLDVFEFFGCTWEESPELRRSHGSVCSWQRVLVVGNVARKR